MPAGIAARPSCPHRSRRYPACRPVPVLGGVHAASRNLAVAGGWLAKAGRILDQDPHECAEQGLLMLPSVVQASIEGDYAQAEAGATRAARSAAASVTLTCLRSGSISSRALLKLGRVREGRNPA